MPTYEKPRKNPPAFSGGISGAFHKRVVQATRKIWGGHEILEVPLPAVISVKTAINEPRFIDYQIKEWAFDQE